MWGWFWWAGCGGGGGASRISGEGSLDMLHINVLEGGSFYGGIEAF